MFAGVCRDGNALKYFCGNRVPGRLRGDDSLETTIPQMEFLLRQWDMVRYGVYPLQLEIRMVGVRGKDLRMARGKTLLYLSKYSSYILMTDTMYLIGIRNNLISTNAVHSTNIFYG